VVYLLLLVHLFNGLFFQDNLGNTAPERQTVLDFTDTKNDGVAVASAGPYANHLHLAPDRLPCQYLSTQFLQAGCPSCCPANSVKALKATSGLFNIQKYIVSQAVATKATMTTCISYESIINILYRCTLTVKLQNSICHGTIH